MGKFFEDNIDVIFCLNTSNFAARLYGAAQVVREALNSPVPPGDDKDYYAEEVAATREALGDEDFAAAWEAGRQLSFEDALRFLPTR